MSWLRAMKDGCYSSPDLGPFEKLGDVIYTNDGESFDLKDGQMFRIGLGGPFDGERYSQWSEEKRAAVKKEWAEKRAAYKREEEERRKIHEALVASARAKLTPEEFDAVVSEGHEY